MNAKVADTPEFCSLPRRLAAMLYDGLLLLGLWILATLIIVIPLGRELDPGNWQFRLYLLVVAWLYFALCWRGGQTLGMKAWRIHLLGSSRPISWPTTIVRFVVALASLACFGLGLIWSVFHPRRSTWHDLASGTVLIVAGKSKSSLQATE